MDRRQRKTREMIFQAFTTLLSQKPFDKITVSEIIELADVGRATFYAHFETKDFLLKELCEELFCHLFDGMTEQPHQHRHIFDCDTTDSVFLHLFRHLESNDNQLLQLLSCPNNELFLPYFKDYLVRLIEDQYELFEDRKSEELPKAFWVNHIAATFVETVNWWVRNGQKESCETITQYFLWAV